MKLQIALGLRKFSNPQLLVEADRYITCIKGNPTFDGASIISRLSATELATAKMRQAVSAPISENKTQAIRIARDSLERYIKGMANEVGNIANAPGIPDVQRVAIFHSAGMKIKTQVIPQKRCFKAVNNSISGSVHLTAQGCKKAHEWQYTIDIENFTGRIPVDSTTKASTNITGLKELTKYAFFHKPIIARTTTDWEGPIFLVVY